MTTNLTPNQLTLLCLIRSDVRKLRPLARLTGKHSSTIFFAVNRLAEMGLVRKPERFTTGALRLTEAGQAAVRDVVLVRQNGRVGIGRFERARIPVLFISVEAEGERVR